MPQDWFSDNSPKAKQPEDWFATNQPSTKQAAPTLMDSRRAASKSEFEANRPDFTQPGYAPLKTVLDAPLDFGIGVERTLGLDPMHPIASAPGAAMGLVEGLGHLITSPVQTVTGLAEGFGKSVRKGGQSLREQNLPEAMQAVGEGYAQAKPAVETAMKVAPVAAKLGLKAAAIPVRAVRASTMPERLMTAAERNKLAAADTSGMDVIPSGYNPRAVVKSAVVAKQKVAPIVQSKLAKFFAGDREIMTPSRIAAEDAVRMRMIADEQATAPRPPFQSFTAEATPQPPRVSLLDQQFLDRIREEAATKARVQQVEEQAYASRNEPPAPPVEAHYVAPKPQRPGVSLDNQAFLKSLREQPPAPKPPPVETIERAIAPSGMKAKLSTLRNAPELLKEVPELDGVKPGPEFDSKLVEGFRRTEKGVAAAQDAVPKDTTVPRLSVTSKLDAIVKDYTERGLSTSAAGVEKVLNQWKELPESIPWDIFRDLKRSFFKDKASAVNNAPTRRAYGVLMDVESAVSSDLKKANRSYSVVRRGLQDANIDPTTGRRIATVGKPTILDKMRRQ